MTTDRWDKAQIMMIIMVSNQHDDYGDRNYANLFYMDIRGCQKVKKK